MESQDIVLPPDSILPETYVTRDESQARVLLNGDRLNILSILIERNATAQDIADQLQLAPAAVNFHLSLLVDSGYAQVVGTRQIGNRSEKFYRGVAKKVSATLMPSDPQEVTWQIRCFFDDLKNNVTKALQRKGEMVTMMRVDIRCRPEVLQPFIEQLQQLQQDFNDMDDDNQEDWFSLAIVLTPRRQHQPTRSNLG